MKKILLLLMLVLLTSCEGYQTMVYAYGIRQTPDPRPRRVYHFNHYYTPYNYNPIIYPVYYNPPRFTPPYFNYGGNNVEQHYHGGRRR